MPGRLPRTARSPDPKVCGRRSMISARTRHDTLLTLSRRDVAIGLLTLGPPPATRGSPGWTPISATAAGPARHRMAEAGDPIRHDGAHEPGVPRGEARRPSTGAAGPGYFSHPNPTADLAGV